MKWERTFELSAPPMRVWDAFTGDEDAEFTVFRRKDAYLSRGAVRIEVGEEVPGTLLEWSEIEGENRWEMSATFTETETGTSVTIVRSGFGESDDWLHHGAGRWLGWQCVMADLEVFYRTGKVLGRFYATPFMAVGVHGFEDGGGLRVRGVVPDSFAAQAGIEEGDIIVSLGGAPVYGLAELWSLPRVLHGDTEVTYLRGADILTRRGVLTPSPSPAAV